MTDSILITKFLTRAFPNEHVVIYLYTCGNVRSPNRAIEQVMSLTKQIFCPIISEQTTRIAVKSFLEYKKKQYIKGEIKIKPIY